MGNRSDLLFNLDTIQAFASKLQKDTLSGQTDLFGDIVGATNIQPTITLQPSPVKHTDRERLAWERELMGLYISAHPLDNFDKYFEEQTVSLSQVLPEADGKKITIGGLITTIRTIVTKNGAKMAFVGIEDKTGESEVIVFPNLYEQFGAKLVQDAVIKAVGKVSARGRDGDLGTEAKIIADDIQIVTDQELRDYESTGRKMPKPKPSNKVQATRVVATRAEVVASVPIIKTVYVQIKNPDDHEALKKLKESCSKYPGTTEIILVIGPDKKSAVKLPFKVNPTDILQNELGKILGTENVAVK